MTGLIEWLETHDKLAGWAQFAGAIAALAITYFTAFAPIWRRKRQLRQAGARLLSHGYEMIESYNRALGHFAPFPISLKGAALSMGIVMEEMSRFPAHELDDQGSNSLARRIVAMGAILGGLKLFLETMANDLGDRVANSDEHEIIRSFVAQQFAVVHAMMTGAELKRPEWTGGSEDMSVSS